MSILDSYSPGSHDQEYLVQDTLDIRLPQGGALIFQQKGTLHAGLGENWELWKDVKNKYGLPPMGPP